MAGSNRPEVMRLKDSYARNPTLFSFPQNKTGHSILFVFKEYDYKGYVKSESSPAFYSQRTRNVGRGIGQRSNAISSTISSFGSVELPFPKQLQDNTSLRLNAFERNAITEAVVNAMSNSGAFNSSTGIGQNFMEQAGKVAGLIQDVGGGAVGLFTQEGQSEALGKLTDGMRDIMNVDTASATAAAGYLMRTLTSKLSGDMSRTIDMVTGTAVNPKEALAFEGVDLRSHSFTWELYPSNRQETETINKITKLFKRNALPETQNLVDGVFEQTFLKYPSTVEIKLIGTNPEYFPRYKPCMIKSVNISFENAAGTVPIMQGGAPGSVTLAVELQEMSAHNRNDVEQVLGENAVVSAQANQLPADF
jgi:hypothetical protein